MGWANIWMELASVACVSNGGCCAEEKSRVQIIEAGHSKASEIVTIQSLSMSGTAEVTYPRGRPFSTMAGLRLRLPFMYAYREWLLLA